MTPSATAPGTDQHEDADPGSDIVRRRARYLPPSYRTFYSDPVELVAGKGALLWDRQGREYVDGYNNVVSVGHGHPRVAQAIYEQSTALCTNTRYLHEGIVAYAEDLLSTFGGRMSADGRAMFTCTGSEANDLALRIARRHTGHNGVIVTAAAYHGNSGLTAAISSSMSAELGPWTRLIPRPDSYRRPQEGLGRWLAAQVQEQIDDLERQGDGLAALMVNSLFSSDGIYAHPTDVLEPVAAVVRAAGGVFIADEVQSGFARTGERMWGYQRHGVEPDIVTMGKPMGNGYPVAGLVVAQDLVDTQMRYFNTFGGNTVAMAAAQATLDVLRDEQLMSNCEQVGGTLLQGLNELASRHELIGDVRGTGLFLGVELVTDRDERRPDTASATAVVNEMRSRGVLISSTGPDKNVLKVRPPLCLDQTQAARLLEELDAALGGVSAPG